MAEDWYADVRKYAPGADSNVVAAIVRYCGIALQNRDSALVSFSDPQEVGRVRENYLKKKLGLTNSDAALDQAIAEVGETMKADRTKNRVTVYYLLAERFRKLSLFGGVDTVAAAARPVDVHPSVVGAGAAAATAAAQSFAAARPAAAGAAAAPSSGLMRWLPWLIGLLLLLLLLWWLFGRGPKPPPPVEAPVAATAPAVEPAVPAAPAVAAQAPVAGLPQNVYFDTGSAVVTADGTRAITAAVDEIKKDAGAKIAITGYTDKTGDQKANQELAKNRAKAVRDAVTASGVPVANIEMQPPMFVEIGANATAGDAEARRVEISKK